MQGPYILEKKLYLTGFFKLLRRKIPHIYALKSTLPFYEK